MSKLVLFVLGTALVCQMFGQVLSEPDPFDDVKDKIYGILKDVLKESVATLNDIRGIGRKFYETLKAVTDDQLQKMQTVERAGVTFLRYILEKAYGDSSKGNDVNKPENKTEKPDDKTTKPDDITKKPDATTKKPDATTKTPDATTKTPDATTKKPDDKDNKAVKPIKPDKKDDAKKDTKGPTTKKP